MESIFGRMKTVGGFLWSKYAGIAWTGLRGDSVAAAYNLARMSKPIGEGEAEVPVFGSSAVVEVPPSECGWGVEGGIRDHNGMKPHRMKGSVRPVTSLGNPGTHSSTPCLA